MDLPRIKRLFNSKPAGQAGAQPRGSGLAVAGDKSIRLGLPSRVSDNSSRPKPIHKIVHIMSVNDNIIKHPFKINLKLQHLIKPKRGKYPKSWFWRNINKQHAPSQCSQPRAKRQSSVDDKENFGHVGQRRNRARHARPLKPTRFGTNRGRNQPRLAVVNPDLSGVFKVKSTYRWEQEYAVDLTVQSQPRKDDQEIQGTDQDHSAQVD